MVSEIRKAKKEIGKFWQYEEDKKELQELLLKVKKLRNKIKKFEETKTKTKNINSRL